MRKTDWPEKLQEYIESHQTTKFSYGEFDCALFASNWVKISTNYDPAKEFRNRYSTKNGSLKRLKEIGGSFSLFEVFGSKMKEEIPVLKAQRGDIVGVVEDGEALGICDGQNVVCLGQEGLVFYDITDKALKVAWRV